MSTWAERREARRRLEERRAEEGVDCPGCGERVLRTGLKAHRKTEKCRSASKRRELYAEGFSQTHRAHDLREAGVRVVRVREWRPPAWGRRHQPERDYAPTWAADLAALLPHSSHMTVKLLRAALEDEERRAALEAAARLGGDRGAVEVGIGWGLFGEADVDELFRPEHRG